MTDEKSDDQVTEFLVERSVSCKLRNNEFGVCQINYKACPHNVSVPLSCPLKIRPVIVKLKLKTEG